MKKRLPTRLLSVLLVAALILGMASPAAAVGTKSNVTVTQVDNSAVSVNPLQRDERELNTMDEYADIDIVRVSIVLEKASTIRPVSAPWILQATMPPWHTVPTCRRIRSAWSRRSSVPSATPSMWSGI